MPYCSYCCSSGRLLSALWLSLIAGTMELPEGSEGASELTRRATGSPPKTPVLRLDGLEGKD